jgi:hypothetical protein
MGTSKKFQFQKWENPVKFIPHFECCAICLNIDQHDPDF